MDKFDVGARLLELRTVKGLSQRALASRAGVPHGQISLVELNRVSPSISSLRKILDGIPISLADFFEPDRPQRDQVFYAENELIDLTSHLLPNGNGGGPAVICRQVGDARSHNLQIVHECYEPGADTGATMLKHVAHEGGIVISGQLEVTVGSEKRVLGPGESFLFDSRRPHRFRNTGTQRTIVITACTPPYI